MGESRYVNLFSWAEGEYKGKVAARFAMDHALAHQIYAGCDMFLMPSQFEPCGLSQLIALRYGTVPIVRETGGLRDTVLSYNEFTGEGNGFSFFNYNAHDMLNVINRAIDYYKNHKDVWALLQNRGMTGDYSWTNSAGKYVQLYTALVSSTSAAAEEASESDAEANPATPEVVEEPVKVKKPRAPRKKKTEEPAAETVTEEKPKRTRKTKAAAEAPAEAAVTEEKPKRGRKPKAAATEEAPEVEKPKKPRAPRKKKTEEPAAE